MNTSTLRLLTHDDVSKSRISSSRNAFLVVYFVLHKSALFFRCVLSVIIRTTTAPPLELDKGVLQFLQRPCEAPAVSLNLLSEINTSTCSCSPSSLTMFGAFLVDSLTNISVSDHSEVCASVSVSKIHTFMSLLLGLQRFIHTFGFKRPPWQQAGLTAMFH